MMLDVPVWFGVLGLALVAGVFLLDKAGGGGRGGSKIGWGQLAPLLGRKAALKAARRRIPAASDPARQDDAVVYIGQYGAHEVFLQHEDSVLVIGPARSGKTRYVAERAVASAVGPALVTSTKADLLLATLPARRNLGQVWVYDPVGVLTPGEAERLGVRQLVWNPIAGCEDPETALRRGSAWAAAQPMSNVRNGDWFSQRSAEVLARLLHAAALGGRDMIDVARWAQDFGDDEPLEILTRWGPRGWDDYLAGLAANRADTTMDSLKMTLGGVLGALASPRVTATLTPRDGVGFDIEDWLTGPNTLYLLAPATAGDTIAPVFTVLVNEVLWQAGLTSQRHERGFLWPPLRCVLDEVANLAPLPSLAAHMSDSGGRGIQVMPIVQSRPQMRGRWGRDGADAIWATATAKLVLPNSDDEDLCREVESQSGLIRRARTTVNTGRGGGSTSVSEDLVPRIRRADVKGIPVGSAWLFYRSLPIVRIDLPAVADKPHARHDKPKATR